MVADKKEEAKEENSAEENFKTSEGGDKEAAEGEEGAEGEVKEVKSSSKLKKILMFVIPLVVLIGGGAGAYFAGVFDGIFPHEKGKISCENIKEGEEGYEECQSLTETDMALHPGAFIKIPDMIVNLKTDDNRPRFLKIALEVEIMSEEDKAKLEPLMPRVIDQFQMYLRELRFEDLKGTSGIYRMKIELLNRVRAVTPGVKVHDILFQEILVQ